MPDSTLSFFVNGKRVGHVSDVVAQAGFSRGRLALDDCGDHPALAAVVALAAIVDTTSPDNYHAAYHDWQRGCSELQDLQLWIGDAATQIEEFTIESDWTIEWRNMDDESVGQ